MRSRSFAAAALAPSYATVSQSAARFWSGSLNQIPTGHTPAQRNPSGSKDTIEDGEEDDEVNFALGVHSGWSSLRSGINDALMQLLEGLVLAQTTIFDQCESMLTYCSCRIEAIECE
jgi:hypothetical protein